MKKNLLFIPLIVWLMFVLLSFKPSPISAQSCGGLQGCSTYHRYDCRGSPPTCVDLGTQTQCSSCYAASGGTCMAQLAMSTGCSVNTSAGTCTETGPINYVSCGSVAPPPPVSTPTAPPVVTPPPGWGGCGSCSSCGGPAGECVTDPGGNCLWDPGSCGSGGDGGDGGGGSDCENSINGLANPLFIGTNDDFENDVNITDGDPVEVEGDCWADGSAVTLTKRDSDGFDWRARGVSQDSSVTITCVGKTLSCPACGDPSEKCRDTATVRVLYPLPWWQAVNASVVSRGNLVSQIPLYGCTLPTCNPVLIQQTSGNSAGVAVYAQGSNYDFAFESSSRGSASVPGWLAQSNVAANFYTYANFLALVEGMSFNTPGNNLNAGAADSKGYIYYRANGDYQITNPQTVTGKVVLFVDGNLTISERISIPNLNNGFFMAIVGGDIIVSPTVGGSPVGSADLEGIFFAQGRFNTSSGSLPLQVSGSVYSNQTPALARDMQNGNRTRPAESFTHVPAMLLNYPQRLVKDQFIWREVAP